MRNVQWGFNYWRNRMPGLNIVRSLKMQEELWKKKQQEEQGEEAKLRLLQETLASQEEGLVRFKAQWEAIQPDLKKARQLDVQIQSQQEGYNQLRQILETACGQVAEQEQKMRMATKQLQGCLSFIKPFVDGYGNGVVAA